MGNKPGRPSEYNERFSRWAGALARAGRTKKYIADEMGIALSTMALWEKEHDAFADAINQGRKLADAEVEDALFKRSTGYEYEETVKLVSVGGGRNGEVRQKTYKRHMPADVKAIMYWLGTRCYRKNARNCTHGTR